MKDEKDATSRGAADDAPEEAGPITTKILSRFLEEPERAAAGKEAGPGAPKRPRSSRLEKDLVEAERVLVRQKDFLESIVANIADGLFVLTPDLKIVKLNAALTRLLGYEESELLGEPVDLLFPEGYRPLDPFATNAVPEPDRWEDPRTDARTREGGTVPVSFRASVIRGRDGRVFGVLGTLRDLRGDLETERKILEAERRAREAAREEHLRAEELEQTNTRLERASRDLQRTQEQLVQSEKLSAVGGLVAGVAHELNNPLTGVLGFSQLLLMGDCEEKVREDLKKIHREALRCQRIVQSLLRFSRQATPQWEEVPIHPALDQILELRAYELRNRDAEVIREYDPDLRTVMGDTQQLQQVFLNIINNALDGMASVPGPARLTIRTENTGDGVRIRFSDTGPGVPEESRLRIFDPFFTTKDVGKGTGLGLSVSHGIVSGHGGQIRLVPSRVGACFEIELPLHAGKRPTPPPPKEVDPAKLGTWRILVIDDEATVLDVLEQLLLSDRHEVIAASTVPQAMKILEERAGEVDLVLSDYKMPGMGGQDLHRLIEERFPALLGRLVFVTGDAANEETREFLDEKGCAYVKKPFRLEEFRRVLSRGLLDVERSKTRTGEIWVLDDEEEARNSIRRSAAETLGAGAGLQVIESVEDLRIGLSRFVPRVLVLDIGITEPPGLDLVRELKQLHPTMRILVLSHHARRREAERAVAAGAEEYLLKPIRIREAVLTLEKILRGVGDAG